MTIEERIEALENELHRARRYNRWLVVVLLVGIGGAAAGLGRLSGVGENVVRATRFVVEDENGKDCAMFYVSENGPALTMLDENRNYRVMLTVVKEGPALAMLDESGKNCVMMYGSTSGSTLKMSHKNGKARVTLGTLDTGPCLTMADKNGKDRVILGSGKKESPDGTQTILPESTLMMFGPDGEVIWTNRTP